MAYKPQDVFIGVIDLFVIILPGGVLLVALLRIASGYPVDPGPDLQWGPVADGLAFAFTAYLLGHIVSLVGSRAEDRLFEGTKWGKTRIKRERPDLRKRVRSLLKEGTHLPADKQPRNVRRWAATVLRVRSTAAAAHIDRKDADRRFFRNMAVVLLLASVGLAGRAVVEATVSAWIEVGVWALLAAASVARYLDQQAKFSRDVFELFLALEDVEPRTSRSLEG